MSTNPARVTSRLIIFAARARSMRSRVNSPGDSGCCPSCWRMNWLSVTERCDMLRSFSVREAGHVLGATGGGNGRASDRERARHERRVALRESPGSRRAEFLEEEKELGL